MSGGKRTPPTARATPTRTPSQNHNHTPTPAQGRPHSRLQPTSTHNSNSDRLHMSIEPTSDGNAKRLSGNGGEDNLATTIASPGPAGKFTGASASPPSFAAVVSASGPARAAAKSPLSTTPFSALNQQQQQQEQAQSRSSSLGFSSNTSILDSGHGIISDNAPPNTAPSAHNSNQSGSLSIQSAHTSSSGPKNAATSGGPGGPASTSTSDSGDAGQDAAQDNEAEDSESSDVEIYLNTLGLHDSAARMHVLGDYSNPNGNLAQTLSQTQVANDSPVIPASAHFQHKQGTHALSAANSVSSAFSGLRIGNNASGESNGTKSLSPLPLSSIPLSPSPSSLLSPTAQQHQTRGAKSPALPQAPVHNTIPLPQVEECNHSADLDAHQLQHLQQHQDMHGGHRSAHERSNVILQGGPIDLSGFSIGGGGGSQPPSGGDQSQQYSLGLPSSHSQPMLTVDAAYNDPNGPPMQSPGASSGFPTSVSDSGLGGVQKTPNVYINGLPPHFPEDQLFTLASPFGEIRSVRTFTRHVRDSESGYGFVLFETIDAAERCINNLRRYRNLHPTYSKQIHKIPGTTYAQTALPSPASEWGQHVLNSGSSSGGSIVDSLGEDASFKAKMESLQDPTSTNLYMEGLPLSIDEPTLAALVSPHRISSSRFFQTRLSNPPRIIAFVRLETRTGAEEIIERLHGRMVRGWNDTGSRISVRFADTSEQRELRRTERSTQEGDGSPARLTIAQAALLNLRGQELRPTTNTGPVIHAHGAGVGTGRIPSSTSSRGGFNTSVSAPDFASNAVNSHSTVGHEGLEVDYSLAPPRHAGSRSRSPYQAQGLGYQQETSYSTHVQLGHTPPAPIDPAMAALLNSLGNSGAPYQNVAGGYAASAGDDLDYMYGQRQQQHGGHHHLPTSQSMDNMHQYARAAPAYTRSGYTATEEYIMRAHAESAALAAQAQAQHQHQQQAERRRPAPLDFSRRRSEEEVGPANIAVGVRGYRAQASLGRIGQGLTSPPMTTTSLGSLSSPMMSMGGMGSQLSEDDFHGSAAVIRNDFRQQLRSLSGTGAVEDGGDAEFSRPALNSASQRHNPNIHPAHVNARLSRPPASSSSSHYQMSPSLTSPPASAQESPNLNDAINYQHAAAHMRSTTLPQHRSSSVRDGQQQMSHARGHYQHSSMSMPAQNLRTPQHASVATLGGSGSIESAHGGTSTIYESEAQEQEEQTQRQRQNQQQQQQQRNDSASNSVATGHSGSASNTSVSAAKSHYSSSPSIFGDLDQPSSSSSPSLISPTLTYGMQTPSTLSPATPFFGSFNSQAEGFEKSESQPQRKLSTGALTSSSLRNQ